MALDFPSSPTLNQVYTAATGVWIYNGASWVSANGGISGTGTANQIAYFTDADTIASLTTATYPSLTELSYVKGVTSAIQTQFTGKLSLTGGTLTGALSGTSASFSSTATATAFIPSGSTVPANGMYLSAANTLDFATNTTNRIRITSGGNALIGTTTPVTNAKVEVSGGMSINSSSLLSSPSFGNPFRASLLDVSNFTFNGSAASYSDGIVAAPSLTLTNTGGTATGGISGFSAYLSINSSAANQSAQMYPFYSYSARENAADLSTTGLNYGVYSAVGHFFSANTSATSTTVSGIYGRVYAVGGSITDAVCVLADNYISRFGSGITATITNYYSFREFATAIGNGSSTATITNYYGLKLEGVTSVEAGSSITNRWGVYQQDSTFRNYFAGNTLIGTTTDAGFKLDVNGTGRFSGDVAIGNTSQGRHIDLFISGPLDGKIYWGSTGSPRQSYIGATGAPNIVAQCGGSGGVELTSGATSWTTLSDERLKNINSNIDSALNKLMTLNAVNFSWKYDNTNKENLGLIAQEIEKVFPQVIDKSILPSDNAKENIDKTEYLSVRYTELIPVLVKAIQEQQIQIEELKSKIN